MAELVTLAEAGRRLGLVNLRQYKSRPGFPLPVRSEHPPLWSWGEVAAWYTSTVKPRKKESQ